MEQLFKDFFSAISPALQTLLVALVTAFVGQSVAWLNKKYQIEKGKLSNEQQYTLEFLASRAVKAVEQYYFDAPNSEKKARAISIVERVLDGYGFTVDVDVIASAVEAQVFELPESNRE